ncbi:MAG: sulfotransferase domain-containing protein [Desulfuromonas sp.]|nr:sulfotransferase domain-containing protein [Desulfuromonas sp.]
MDYSKIFNNLPAPGQFPACFAFSIHKAGSTLMHKMINEVCNAAKIPAVTIPDKLFLEGFVGGEWEDDPDLLALITDGRIYYGWRHLPKILQNHQHFLRERQSVLLVRDPRDALVSAYYSFGGKHASHRLPDKNKEAFVARLEANEDLDIDTYVLRSAKNHLNKLLAYQSSLDFDRVLLRRYEEIYFNKRKFLGEIFDHFGLDVPTEILDQVAARNDVRPAEEDPTKHIRKGTPGDHREKLRPETIAKLNALFRETCRWYGYDLDA